MMRVPKHLFMNVAITRTLCGDIQVPCLQFRSRLENQVVRSHAQCLNRCEDREVSSIWIMSRMEASGDDEAELSLITDDEIEAAFERASMASKRRGDEGVRQREFLNLLHDIAEGKIQEIERGRCA